MTMRAVDFNHWKTVSNWPQLSAAVDAIILKATQYTTFTDPAFAANLAQARKTSKCVGVYHFVGRNGMQTAKLPPGDPGAEADWFLSKYAHQSGEMVIVDYEPDAEPADPDTWLAAHCARIIALTGVIPVIYMNTFTAAMRSWAKTRALGCALWAARYYANNGQISGPDPAVGPWGSFIGWQYTSNGTLPGISAQVDLSRFDLTPDQWRAYGLQGADMPLTDADAAVIWNHILDLRNGSGPATAADWLRDGRVDAGRAVAQLTGTNVGAFSADVRGDLANKAAQLDAIQAAVGKDGDPAALADAVVAAMGAEFAQKVIDALGQRINATQPPSA